MTKQKSSSGKRKQQRTRRRQRGNNVQGPGLMVNYSPHVRCIFPPLPRELSTALSYKYVDNRVGNTNPSSFTFGLFEFLNQRPMFSSELFNIYRYCRITAVHIRAECVNTGSEPVIIAIGTIPWAAATSTFDPYLIAERPRSISRLAGLSTGMSRVTLNKTYMSFDELGNPVYDKTHFFDSVQSISTTPQDQEAPAVIVSVDSADPTKTWSALTTYHVTYHTQWFELQWADYANRSKPAEEGDACTISEKSWVEPSQAQKNKMRDKISKKSVKG